MKIVIGLLFVLAFNCCSGQSWYSRSYNITGGQEAGRAMTFEDDSVLIRMTTVCDTTLCTLLGLFNHSENDFVKVKEYEGVQTGFKNIILMDSFIFLSSEERNLSNNISVSKFNKLSLDLIMHKDLRIDSNQYFNYVVGPSIKFIDRLVIGANALDSTNYIDYQGWHNYQAKTVLFVLNDQLLTASTLVIPPSSGAFLQIEDMSVGPDSLLYISFYEKYLKQGNPNLFLEIRKVIYGYNRNMQKVFEWIGPDFDVPESITCITIGEDSTLYFNYKHDFRTFLAALNPDGSLKWECLFDSNPGNYLYNIRRLVVTKNGDILGAGFISSAFDELGESGFIFRADSEGHLLWKRALRVNKGMDFTIPPEFPFRANLEDVVELPNGDILASGYIRKYVGFDYPDGPYNYDVWIVRTNEHGCISPNCPFIQDIVFKDQYIRLVSPRNGWVVDVDTSAQESAIRKYTFDPDSVLIQNKIYYKLLYTATLQGPWEETGRLMREDNGKVYELNPVDSLETLLYDFDMQTGDTLVTHQDGSENTRRVIGVGTVKLWDEVIRKTITISCTSNISDPDTTTWIEGMGDMEQLFWTRTYCGVDDVTSINRDVRCFLVDDLAIYSRPGIPDCYITPVEDAAIGEVSVYPNPTSGVLYFDLPRDQWIQSISLYNYLGQKIITNTPPVTNTLDVSFLPKGSYFGVILIQNGSAKRFKCIII